MHSDESLSLHMRSSLSHRKESGQSTGHVTQRPVQAGNHGNNTHKRVAERAKRKAKSGGEVHVSPSKDTSEINSGLSHKAAL